MHDMGLDLLVSNVFGACWFQSALRLAPFALRTASARSQKKELPPDPFSQTVYIMSIHRGLRTAMLAGAFGGCLQPAWLLHFFCPKIWNNYAPTLWCMIQQTGPLVKLSRRPSTRQSFKHFGMRGGASQWTLGAKEPNINTIILILEYQTRRHATHGREDWRMVKMHFWICFIMFKKCPPALLIE